MKIIVSLFFIVVFFTACSNEQVQTNKAPAFNTEVIIHDSFNIDEVMTNVVDKKVFLTGEMHGIKENYILRLDMLIYFHETFGVNYYIAEMGYSSGYFINKYLESGEIKYLNLVANSIVGSYDHSLEDYNFWKDLYNYNLSLPIDERIQVVGLDIEHQFWLALIQLDYMLGDLDLGSHMEGVQKELKRYSTLLTPDIDDTSSILNRVRTLTPDKVLELFNTLKVDFFENHSLYESLLSQTELEELSFTISTVSETERIYTNKTDRNYFNAEREKVIYNNFLKLFEEHSNSKFFGQWGSFHILQFRDNEEARFAEYLNSNNSPVKDQVVSIKYIYDNKTHQLKNRLILTTFKRFTKEKFTLYDISKLEINKKGFSNTEYGADELSDFFQYGILIQDPQKVSPLIF